MLLTNSLSDKPFKFYHINGNKLLKIQIVVLCIIVYIEKCMEVCFVHMLTYQTVENLKFQATVILLCSQNFDNLGYQRLNAYL